MFSFPEKAANDMIRLNRVEMPPRLGQVHGVRPINPLPSSEVKSGEYQMRLTPPTNMTFFISILLAALSIIGQFVSMISNYIPISMFWVAIIAYIVLFMGNVVRGF